MVFTTATPYITDFTLELKRFVGEIPRLGNWLIYHLALNDVQTLTQLLIVAACLLPTLISKLQDVRHCSVGERQSRSIGHCTWDVGYALVQDTIHIVYWILVGCWV